MDTYADWVRTRDDDELRALLAASPDDHHVLAQGMSLFEGLYATSPRKG